ncbi:MEDIATOR OF RNA polymerase II TRANSCRIPTION SUBUNIT 26C-RELATED [Salix purpurea]|uniref:MEDIATOR OF RNA polymerase II TRANSCRIPTION SUBUNIT 26C-RELATED n=1 Tax=Salix purpurea TaxID=77065 RepID=A0A9Q0ZRW1_SALPP|nr:MEDIATOR OF RNA polymerase II TRANSCRIPTION SUBUNIT 26C-RELATED [Salix purpurea]
MTDPSSTQSTSYHTDQSVSFDLMTSCYKVDPEFKRKRRRRRDDDELDPYGGFFDDEPKKIWDIKQQLEDIDQPEDLLVDLLQSLADMDITFQALQETYIGRNVNQLRLKHSSNDVRRLANQLVRNWKEIVYDWHKESMHPLV